MRAIVSAARVLATPGGPSRRQCPRPSQHTNSRSIMRSCPTRTRLASNKARSITTWGDGWGGSGITETDPSFWGAGGDSTKHPKERTMRSLKVRQEPASSRRPLDQATRPPKAGEPGPNVDSGSAVVAVPDAPHGGDPHGVGRIVLDLVTEALHGHVDQAGVAQVVVAPDPFEQHVP